MKHCYFCEQDYESIHYCPTPPRAVDNEEEYTYQIKNKPKLILVYSREED